MEEKIKKESLERLNVKSEVIAILEQGNITSIGQLCKKSRADLREMGIETTDVKKLEIELQLLGLNLSNSL